MDKILIIDDDKELCVLVSELLEVDGFEVKSLNTADQALDEVLSGKYTLVVLDVMLPKTSGFEVLRSIRSQSKIPVLMLTARGEDVDKIVGLEMGADDYLPKPFNPRELLARIRAILRRFSTSTNTDSQPQTQETLVVDDLHIDLRKRIVNQNGKVVNLTYAEFDLLHVLLSANGSIISREDLAKEVLGRKFTPFDRTIDTHISNLRKKLGSHPDGNERIKAIRGLGYRYVANGE
jgi:two-component system response regulator CpxR